MGQADNQESVPFRILLVDDEPSVLFALKLLLEALGYKPHDFSIATAALDFLKGGNDCDLFICDLKMPRMNGLEVLAAVKMIRADLPFVLMSAHATSGEVDMAKQLGAIGFLAKPFTPEQLNEVVNTIKADKVSKAASR